MKKGAITTLMGAILVVLVIAVVIPGFYYAYNSIFKKISAIEWTDLPSSEQQKVLSGFDSFVNLLKSCESKENCFCGGEAGFPLAFRDEESMTVENKEGISRLVLQWKNALTGKEATINSNMFVNYKATASYANIIQFEKGKYLINGNMAIQDRPAFSKIGGDLFVFTDKKAPLFSASSGFVACK